MERKIKVHLIINGLYRGGAQKILSDLIEQGDHERFLYRVIYLNPIKAERIAETYIESIREKGIEITEVGGNHLGVVLKLLSLFRSDRPDLIQTFLPLASIFGRISGAIAGIPVVSLQCNLPHVYPPLIRIADQLTLGLCRVWLGASRGIEEAYAGGISERYSEGLWLQGRRHFTVYAGVDVPLIRSIVDQTDPNSLRTEFSIPGAMAVVLMVARLVPWKGHRTLLKAMARVPDAHLILVGWGPMEEELRKLASDLGLGERVHFAGQRSDVYQLLASADIFVQTHEVESNGLVWQGPNLAQMEAAAAGTPSISSRVPHIEELIEDNVTGRLVILNDSDHLAATIKEMLIEREHSRQLGIAAAERAAAQFSVSSMVSAYEHIWTNVVQSQ
jgi:L-malate glycosyltransferase